MGRLWQESITLNVEDRIGNTGIVLPDNCMDAAVIRSVSERMKYVLVCFFGLCIMTCYCVFCQLSWLASG